MLIDISKKWTEPKISTSGKEWFVWFRFYDETTKSWKPIKRKGGANYAKFSKRERLDQLNILRQAIAYRLEKLDWDPITNTCIQDEQPSVDQQINDLGKMSFIEAVAFAKEKKQVNWGHKTNQGYSIEIKYILEAARQLKLHNKVISEFKKAHFKTILGQVRQNRNLSPKGYNKYRSCLSNIMGELAEWDIWEYNPIHKVKTMMVAKTFAHRPPTEEERSVIMQHLRANYSTFYRFCFTLYATTIREKEVLGLQVIPFLYIQ